MAAALVIISVIHGVPALAEESEVGNWYSGPEGLTLDLDAHCDYAHRSARIDIENEGTLNDVDLVVWSRDGSIAVSDLDVGEKTSITFGNLQRGQRFGWYVTAPLDYEFWGPSEGGWQCPIDEAVAEPDSGYWMVNDKGLVTSFGRAQMHLTTDFNLGLHDTRDFEVAPDNGGHWLMNGQGGVKAVLSAGHFGSAERLLQPGESTTSFSATPSGAGYWLFTDRGRALAFGDARHFGDLAGVPLVAPIVDSVATPSGNGYYLVAGDGGVFTFGDARFNGSTGNLRLNAPVQSLVPDPDGAGYWLVASDGGVFAFNAPFLGSTGGLALNKPVIGMVAYGDGYLMVAEDGGIFNFSSKEFYGSLALNPYAGRIVAVDIWN